MHAQKGKNVSAIIGSHKKRINLARMQAVRHKKGKNRLGGREGALQADMHDCMRWPCLGRGWDQYE
jgi:hypothetical protein